MGSFVLFSTKFNSNIYSFFCFATNSIQKLIQFSFFNKIQFKSWFNSLVSNKIQFKNIFKMLKLAVFNSIKYSFNMKTWVSDRATQPVNLHFAFCRSRVFFATKEQKRLLWGRKGDFLQRNQVKFVPLKAPAGQLTQYFK